MLVLQEGQPRISTNEMFFACPMRGTARNVSIQNEFHGVLFIGYSLPMALHRNSHGNSFLDASFLLKWNKVLPMSRTCGLQKCML